MPISEAVPGNQDDCPKASNGDQASDPGRGRGLQAESTNSLAGGPDAARQDHAGHGSETEEKAQGTNLEQELMGSRRGLDRSRAQGCQTAENSDANTGNGSLTPSSIVTPQQIAGGRHGEPDAVAFAANGEQNSVNDPDRNRVPVSEDGPPLTASGVSGWSHQALAPHKTVVEEHKQEDEWQDMPAFAPYDIYNDDGKLVAREERDSDGEGNAYEGLGGAGKGYTRVQVDEDALSATSMDDNTNYLFKAPCTDATIEDEEQRDASAQLQATKDLLTEGQRIAYVGVTRLALAQITKELGEVESTKGTKKESKMAVESMKRWSQEMMLRLYAHMEIDSSGMPNRFHSICVD